MRVLLTTLIALAFGATLAADVAQAQQPAPAGAPAPVRRTAEGFDKSEADLIEMLKAPVRRADAACTMDRARVVAATENQDVYEVACQDKTGFLLFVTIPHSNSSALTVTRCVSALQNAAQKLCTLTTLDDNMVPFKDLATKAQRPCAAARSRFVGETGDGSFYFEYACPDDTGFMLLTDQKGAVKSQLPCSAAGRIAGGCTLTTVTASNDERTVLAAAARAEGFDCTVSRFGEFPKRDGAKYEATEIACSNRQDGGVVMKATDGGKTMVANCLRARAEGFRCGMTDEKLAYPALTNELKNAKVSEGRNWDCAVNGAQAIGSDSRNAYLEVTCSDGSPGLVISYPLGDKAPKEFITCRDFGACKMPGNTGT